MKQIATLLLLMTAALPLGGKWKVKEKRFDPVRITDVRHVAGRYVGIDPDYVVSLQLADDGTVTGTMTDFGVTSTLRDIRIEGSEFNARVGGLPLHGTFVNRVRNRASTFGLLIHDTDIKIEDLNLSQIFCRRG